MVYFWLSVSLQGICQSRILQALFSSNFLHMFAHLHDADVESDIDFLTVAGQDMQDMQDLQRPTAPLAWVLCAAASSRFVPLFFASFRNCFDVRRSISWRTRAWPATKRVQRGTRGRSTCTAKSAGRKVRRAGELCQSTVSTFVTASDAKSSGCTASHRCIRGRES